MIQRFITLISSLPLIFFHFFPNRKAEKPSMTTGGGRGMDNLSHPPGTAKMGR